MSNKDTFLHKEQIGVTICFSPNVDDTVTICWQRTLDPNEDLDEEVHSKEAARAYWKTKVKQGYKPATYWHQCKRDWSENRD